LNLNIVLFFSAELPDLQLFQLLLSYCRWPLFSVASASLSEPLSESPSTIAAVTKDKILSIDLEASSFDGITNLLHEDQS
jgi:hypothetical protein